MEIKTVLSLLTVTSQEVRLINDLNDCFKFDHNIFLVDSSADVNRFVNMNSGITPKSLFLFESANGNVAGGVKHLWKIRSKNTFMIVVPESSTFVRNSNLLRQIRKIQLTNVHRRVTFGIFFQNTISMEDLRSHLLWFRDLFIPNVFAACPNTERSLNVFTFHSFGKFEVVNLTSRNTCEEFYPNLDSNYHQHEFRVSQFDNAAYQQFWSVVFQIMNATFRLKYAKYSYISQYIQNGIDVIPNVAAFSPEGFSTYPFLLMQENIIVPEAEPYSGFYAYVRALTTNEFFGYSAGAFIAIVFMLVVCRYIKEKKILFFPSFMDVLTLLINDNGYIKYQRLSRAETFIIVPLTFIGLVVVNGFLSSLQSYLTKPALQPQLKTLADIYNSPLNITTPPHWLDEVVETVTFLSKHENWSDKVTSIEGDNYQLQIYNFNTSTSYLITDSEFKLMLNAQRRLNIRGFYDIGVTLSSTLCSFRVTNKFLFLDKLNEIIHWTITSGLLYRWFGENDEIVEKWVVKLNRNKLEHQPSADDFEFPMFMVYGWVVSTIVFIVEILWSKFKKTSHGKVVRRQYL